MDPDQRQAVSATVSVSHADNTATLRLEQLPMRAGMLTFKKFGKSLPMTVSLFE